MFLEKLRDSQPAQVVYSYAPEDKNNISEFDKYLRVLKRNGLIKTWSEQNILAGENLQQVKYNKLKNADIVLLMLSPDFFVHEESMNIYDTILSLGTNNKIHVIPILIRNCLWKQSFAKRLQILPKNQIPICNWEIKEDAYQNIAEELITVVSTIRASLPKKDEKNIKITLTINNEELSDSDKTKLLQGLEQILGMSQGKLEIEGIKTQKFNNSVVTKVLVRAPRHEYGELMALKEIGSLKHLNIININTKDFIIKTFDFIRKHIYKSHLLNDITLISEASFDGAIDVNIGDYSQQKNNVQDLSLQSNYSKDIGDFRQHGDLYKSKNNTNIGDFGNNKSDFY